jgi:hypothetical protein
MRVSAATAALKDPPVIPNEAHYRAAAIRSALHWAGRLYQTIALSTGVMIAQHRCGRFPPSPLRK